MLTQRFTALADQCPLQSSNANADVDIPSKTIASTVNFLMITSNRQSVGAGYHEYILITTDFVQHFMTQKGMIGRNAEIAHQI
jgi:hypothetical protein